jgi:hypothetical protein
VSRRSPSSLIHRSGARALAWGVAVTAASARLGAQDSLVTHATVAVTDAPVAASAVVRTRGPAMAVPFGVGEHAEYSVKFGIVHVGSGTMDVAELDSLRGHDVWHTVMHIQGGTLFYHVNDQLESWFDTRTLASLRFLQHLEEGGAHRSRDYLIYPERQTFIENQKPEQPSVAAPLDDASFLYFVRTIPLVVGETYTLNRYFNPRSNPVKLRVLRRESVSVPAGTFNAIVIQPIIKTSGIFSQHGEAQIWLSDDSARVVLQLKSKLSFGSLALYLRAFRPAAGSPAPIAVGRATADARDTASRAIP